MLGSKGLQMLPLTTKYILKRLDDDVVVVIIVTLTVLAMMVTDNDSV